MARPPQQETRGRIDLAHSSRTWTGARTPQAIKRVRQAATRHEVLQPRRSAAKTFVAKAVTLAQAGDADGAGVALLEALSALDRAAKVGAIHANAAARRKSRLTLKVNAALGGATLVAGSKATRATGRAAAAKAAKARIAAGKATKAKGEQTAAGKARAALSRSTREAQAASATLAEAPAAATAPARPSTKAAAAKATTKASAKATTTKAPAKKASASASKPAPKASASKTAPKPAAKTASKSPRASSAKS